MPILNLKPIEDRKVIRGVETPSDSAGILGLSKKDLRPIGRGDTPYFDAGIESVSRSEQAPKKEQGLLMKTLENVNRPQYAVANTLYKAIVDKDFNIIKNLSDGLSLKEKKSIGDILVSEFGVPESTLGKVGFFMAGFAGDILTDPLTYTGVGLLGKSGKLLKGGSTAERLALAGREAGKAGTTQKTLTFAGKAIPGTEKVIDPLAKGLNKAKNYVIDDISPIGKLMDSLTAVSTKLRPRDVDPVVWEKFLIAREKAANIKSKIELDSLEKAKEIQAIIKQTGLSTEEVALITNKIESGQKATTKVGQLAQDYSKELTDKYKNVGETGKSVIEEDSFRYLPHLVENKNANKALGLSSKKYTTKSASDIKRTILKITDDSGESAIISTKTGAIFKDGKKVKTIPLKELNQLKESGAVEGVGSLSQATISEINKNIGEVVFSSNLPKLVYVQGKRTAKVVSGDEFFKKVLPLGSKTPKVSKKGVEFIETQAPELAGRYFPKEVAEHVNETYKRLTNVEEINSIIKNIDNVQNVWKSTATFWNVPFHTRNAISNVWQNTLAGVNNPLDYKSATQIQMRSRFPRQFGALDDAEIKILNEFKDQGLVKTGWLTGDIDKSLDQEILGAFDLLKKKRVVGAISKIGGNVGESIENNAKLAHFIAKRREGLSAFDAGQSVKKYLFDYSDLTKVEKEVLKRAFPFYTWTRKNIPLQLETLAKDPARQTKLLKLKNNVEVLAGDDTTNDILPDWLKDAAPIYVGKKDGKVRYVKMGGFLPTTDLTRLSDPVKEMYQMLTPILTKPTEQIFNRNFYFGADITKQKGIKGFTGIGEKDFLWWQIPGRLEHLATLFRPVSELSKLVGNRAIGQSAQQRLLNTMLGGKIYEFDTKDLLRQFDKRITDEEIRPFEDQIAKLRYIAKKNPERQEKIKEDIRNLNEGLQKAKKDAKKKKQKARSSL